MPNTISVLDSNDNPQVVATLDAVLVTQGAPSDAAYTDATGAAPGSAISLLKAVAESALSTNPVPVVGPQTTGVTVTTNPVVVGAAIVNVKQSLANSAINYLKLSTGSSLLTYPYTLPEASWQFAVATGGISNTTTAVTLQAAVASYRNYLTEIQICADALGAATEIAIRDGAGGTVLWRMKIGTSGLSITNITFPTPLRGSTNTLMEFATLTASVTGSVYISAAGFQHP